MADSELDQHNKSDPQSTDATTDVITDVDPNKAAQTPIQANSKIDILLRATGDAPIMKKKNWKVDSYRTIGWINEFIRRYIKIEPNESLFLYVNQTFAPSPDQNVDNLLECFGSDGKLVLYYARSQAWG